MILVICNDIFCMWIVHINRNNIEGQDLNLSKKFCVKVVYSVSKLNVSFVIKCDFYELLSTKNEFSSNHTFILEQILYVYQLVKFHNFPKPFQGPHCISHVQYD